MVHLEELSILVSQDCLICFQRQVLKDLDILPYVNLHYQLMSWILLCCYLKPISLRLEVLTRKNRWYDLLKSLHRYNTVKRILIEHKYFQVFQVLCTLLDSIWKCFLLYQLFSLNHLEKWHLHLLNVANHWWLIHLSFLDIWNNLK